MVKNKKGILILVVFLTVNISFGQVNRYMVFFSDKANSEYSVDQPEQYLSPRAINRRIKYQIPVTVQDLPVNEEYIIGIKNLGIDVFFNSRWFNATLVEMDASLIELVEAQPYVRKIEYVAPGTRLLKERLNQNTPFIKKSAEKSDITNAFQNNMIGVDLMHQEGFTGKNILIGIFDAGFTGVNQSVYFQHLFDKNKIVGVRDFIRNSANVYQYDDHGTGVLSTISGFDESIYEGIAYDANVILCVTEDVPTEYLIEEYNWLFAAEFADSSGVDIINTSLGYNTFDNPVMNYTYDNLDGNTSIITQATDIAAAKGILCVVSVGNEGNNSWKKLVAPADADSVLAVGAVNADLQYINFSSTGPSADNRIKPEVAALGQGTKIVQYDGEISTGNGTSFASPLVAGLAAGLWEAYPELSNMELIDLIKRGSSQYSQPDTLLGYGIPDYRKIQSVITAIDDDLLPQEFKIYPNPVDNHKLFVEFAGVSINTSIVINISDVNGKNVFLLRTQKFDNQNNLELDLQGLNKGIYILNLVYGQYSGSVKILIP